MIGYKFKIILCVLLVGCLGCSEKSQTTAVVEKDSLSIVSASGYLMSMNSAVISTPSVSRVWNYKITYLAPEGKMINAGDVVAKFDTSDIKLKLQDKRNELLTEQKNLEAVQMQHAEKKENLILEMAEAKMNLEKAEQKWQQSKILESRFETKRLVLEHQMAKDSVVKFERLIDKHEEGGAAKIASVKSKVSRLESVVRQYEEAVTSMTLEAPKSGFVVYKERRGSGTVSVGERASLGQPLIEIPSLDTLLVKAEIAETYAGKVAVGQSVDIVLDAASDRVFKGRVERLGTVFRRKNPDQPNIVFDADIVIDNMDSSIMRPGMAARLKIVVDSGNALIAQGGR